MRSSLQRQRGRGAGGCESKSVFQYLHTGSSRDVVLKGLQLAA